MAGWQAAAATTYVARLSAIYARLSKVLTPAGLKLACDKHATVLSNALSARSALHKLRDEHLIKEMREPLSDLKAIDTFKSLGASIELSIVELGNHNDLLASREACMELMQAIGALHGEHCHPDAHEPVVMRNVVGKPGTLDVLAANSGHTTRNVDGTVYTVITPRRAHFGAVGPIFKPRAADAGPVRSGFAEAQRIGTITSDAAETIQEFRRATEAANLGEFIGIIAGSMLRALGAPGAVDNLPSRELLAISRVWSIVVGEVSQCANEDRHLFVKAVLFVHVESEGQTGAWLYQMAPEFTDLMWDKLARCLHPSDLEYFFVNIERSIDLMTKTAEQGALLYFQLDETSAESAEHAESASSVTESAECKRNSDDTLEHAATKRACRESTEL